MEIPLDQRKCKDLVTLDTIHAFCGGPMPTPETCRLQAYTHRRKFLLLAYLSSISILVLNSCHHLSLFFVSNMDTRRQKALVRKANTTRKQQQQALPTLKRKNIAKDNCPSKKGTCQLIGEQHSKLVTLKDYAIEMVSSIIKEMDLDPCGEHSLEDLGAFGLYDLSRVCPCHLHYTSKKFLLILTVMLGFRRWCI